MRILNKNEEPMAFIIWAFDDTIKRSKQDLTKEQELKYLTELAVH